MTLRRDYFKILHNINVCQYVFKKICIFFEGAGILSGSQCACKICGFLVYYILLKVYFDCKPMLDNYADGNEAEIT